MVNFDLESLNAVVNRIANITKLANKVDVTRQCLSKNLSGETKMTIKTFVGICRELNLNPNDFFIVKR